MEERRGKIEESGQTLIEYATVVALVAAVLIAMTPLVRRGTQGMIRTVADQIGEQNESDQIVGPQNASNPTFNNGPGYLVSSYSATRVDINKQKREFVGLFNYITPGDTVSTTSNAFLNLGFTQEQPQ